jgi:hypothetical protein
MGFVLARRPPNFEAIFRTLANEDLVIPPGASDFPVTASFEMPWRVMITSLFPHMHLRGKGYRLEAILPDSTRELLLQLDTWDFDWQFSYDFREWRAYPMGTKLVATAWYDNSAGNPDNPDPTKEVRHGQGSEDEMMVTGLELVRPNRRPPLTER